MEEARGGSGREDEEGGRAGTASGLHARAFLVRLGMGRKDFSGPFGGRELYREDV